jgi:hypothetical protein
VFVEHALNIVPKLGGPGKYHKIYNLEYGSQTIWAEFTGNMWQGTKQDMQFAQSCFIMYND